MARELVPDKLCETIEPLLPKNGVLLSAMLTAANLHDSMVFEELIDAIELIKRPRGRPRKRPKKPHSDKTYAMTTNAN